MVCRDTKHIDNSHPCSFTTRVPGGSMTWSLDLAAHTSLSPIRHGFAPSFAAYQKGCTRLAAASDTVCQLRAHGRWFSLASSTTKTGRHDIAEILLKVALNTINQIVRHNSETALYQNIIVMVISAINFFFYMLITKYNVNIFFTLII